MSDKPKLKRIKPSLYEVMGEVRLKDKATLNKTPRKYKVFFVIYLPGNEEVRDVKVMPAEERIQPVWIKLEKLEAGGTHPRWLSYEFEIEKDSNDCVILELFVNPDTDPKPKVIYEDPIEIDPDDTGHH